MKLSDLHENYIDVAKRSMFLGKNPITPARAVPVIIPVDKWEKTNEGLVKRFRFRRPEDRRMFVNDLLEYEDQVQHHAEMTITEGEVLIKLSTKTIDKVTELDKEYSLYCDSVFKDISYRP